LSFPSVKPITAQTFNYASIITIGVMLLSGLWYVLGAHRHYHGPRPNIGDTHDRITDNNVPALPKTDSQSEDDQKTEAY
jgi:hypothetical protein